MPISDPDNPDLTLVLSAMPEVQVYVTQTRQIAISVISLHESMDKVQNEAVYLPIEYAERVGKHLLEIAAAAK